MAAAQISATVGVNVGTDSYDTVAPGDPVESVDVFYDQLSPYGVWVDEPDVGRVFVPEAASYVPYTSGHWQYTNLGFVWVSSEPHAWATAHYGRWAYSNYYGRWYWMPDTEWGPAWVEWRQTGSDFGWAPLAPEIVMRTGWRPPVESWHYCGAAHILDRDVTRYYAPRARVVEIHRTARPVEHYATVSNVRVVVGPPAAVLREHRVAVRPVKVEARAVGRWTPTEARAQVVRAREHQGVFEAQNQRRIETNAQIRNAHVKVIESHPQIKAQVTARVAAPARVEPNRPARVEPNRPARAEPNRPAERGRTPVERVAPNPVERGSVEHGGARPPERRGPERVAPTPPVERAQREPARPAPAPRVEPARPAPAPRVEPARPAPAPRVEPARPAPAPRAEPARPAPAPRAEPARPAPTERAQTQRPEQRREPARDDDRKAPERR